VHCRIWYSVEFVHDQEVTIVPAFALVRVSPMPFFVNCFVINKNNNINNNNIKLLKIDLMVVNVNLSTDVLLNETSVPPCRLYFSSCKGLTSAKTSLTLPFSLGLFL
jgi:hypothetical protein